MKHRAVKHRAMIVLALCAACTSAPAQESDPADGSGAEGPTTRVAAPPPVVAPSAVGLAAVPLDSIGIVLEGHVSRGLIAGGVAGVARDGQIAWIGARGVQDLGNQRPMSQESVFRIYSMTKTVTAVGAMILQERGAFDLDDPVADYLPEFAGVTVLEEDGTTRPPASPVTVRHLLLHTAGLSHRSSAEYREAGVRARDVPLTRFIENITAVPLRFDPGSRFRYSASPTVLGRLIEVWSGQSLDRFFADEILDPLGMADTGFQVRTDQLDRFASVYRSEAGQPLRPHQIEEVPFTERPALLEGSVGLVSTVPDFLRFGLMLANGGRLDEQQILSEESVRFLTTNGVDEALLPIFGGGHGWGPGSVSVVVDPSATRDATFPGEYRWDGSAGTEFWVDPGTGTVLVTAWQSAPANPDGLRQTIRRLVRNAIRTGAG